MATQGLEYIISLTDQITGPLKGVVQSIDTLGNRGRDAMTKIGAGVAGIIATGMSLHRALSPAIDFSRALSEVSAAGVRASGLAKIEKFALDFSSSFGLAAGDVVNSANEIARAIDGLTDDELIGFTRGSNLLAKATGSSVKEMGSYLSTMYGIFQAEADKMGKAKWIEMMSGQATLTANMFKSSGESLSQAFTNLMATGQSKGVDLAEQFAVLGNLQSVMPGGMSGTKYGAFLKGVGKAQKALGLEFLDSQKRMLPITDILTEIKRKYGSTIDEIEALNIKKAFGSDQAVDVISYLLPKIDQLKGNINEISGVKNLDDAVAVSKMTTDSWMRLSAILQNIKISIGGEILKKIEPLLNQVADLGQEFVNWLKTYKNIARWIGYLVGSIVGVTAITASITLFSGITKAAGVALQFAGLQGKIFSSSLGIITKIVPITLSPIRDLILWLSKFGNPFQALFRLIQGSIFRLIASFKALFVLVKSGFTSLHSVVGRFLISLAISPVATFKHAVQLAFGAIGKSFKLIFSPFNLWFLLIGAAILFVYKFRDNFKDLWAGIKQGFGSVSEHLSPLKNVFESVKGAIGRIINAVVRVVNVFTDSSNAAENFHSVGVSVGEAVGFALDGVVAVAELLAIGINGIADIFVSVAESIISSWEDVKKAWADGSVWDIFTSVGSMISNVFGTTFRGIVNLFVDMLNTIIEKANALPGINIPLIPKWEDAALTDTAVKQAHLSKNIAMPGIDFANKSIEMVVANGGGIQRDTGKQNFSLSDNIKPQFVQMPQGSLTKQIQQSKTINRTVNYGGVTIHSDNAGNIWQQLKNREEMAAG